MFKNRSHQQALLALLLVVPFASLGEAMTLHVPGLIGGTVSLACKIWFWALPLAWWLWIDQGKLRLPKLQRQHLLVGTVSGLLFFAIIVGAYLLIGKQWIDVVEIRNRAQEVGFLAGLFNRTVYIVYIASGLFYSFINSLIEELVWRGFVYSQCEVLIPAKLAVFLSALFFTLHHIIDLAAYFDWRVIVLGSSAVFIAGVVWSWFYRIHRSIWPSYISHVLADLAIFVVGFQILFK